MGKTNWIIVKSKGRGIEYGVGTFVNNMLQGLSAFPELDIFVIEIGGNSKEDFYIDKKDDITYFHFGKAWHFASEDTVTNLAKHARNTVRVLQPFIPNDRRTVVHLNFIYQHFLGKEFKKVYNAIVISTQHVFTEEFDENKFSFDLEKQTCQLVDQVVTVTKHGKDYLVGRGNDAEKITTIYNGISPMLFKDKLDSEDVLNKYGISSSGKFILYSGRLDPIKGLKYLAEAFKIAVKKIPNCHLVVAGDGNSHELINACQEVSSNIHCIGFIPFHDLIAFYQRATIGVIPSLEEHCSYVALEMLHSGLPVVASNLGGLKEIFIHDENALLVGTVPDSTNIFGVAPDVKQMAESMITLLKDEVLRDRFSVNGRRRAINEFTASLMTQKYIDLTLNIKKHAQDNC